MKVYITQMLWLVGVLSQSLGQVHHVKLLSDPNPLFGCTILVDFEKVTFKNLPPNDLNFIYISMKPTILNEKMYGVQLDTSPIITDLYSRSKDAISNYIDSLCKVKNQIKPLKGLEKNMDKLVKRDTKGKLEVRKLVDNGDAKNRIDVVFMGDGYTSDEKSAFFSDMERLTKDMFEGPTFKSYLPLINIWSIFVPSNESGIGYFGPKDTAFKLTRDRGQLRGVFCSNPEYARQVCKLTGDQACDFPAIIGNDDYYGGLEGEFTIATKSNRTGTVVLRHEMGHNFVEVGEEYDNGASYLGVNTAKTLEVGWKHWLSGPIKEERAIYRLLQYPWHDLSKGSKSFTFTSDGTFSKWYMLASVTAAGQNDSLEFLLDGKVLEWETRGSDDREFYDWSGPSGFTKGSHTVTVRSKTSSTNTNIPRMIASLTLHEFGSNSQFNDSNNHYSAYPTWDYKQVKTYRPTNAGCLMRNMTHPKFCSVCKEGMWLNFLKKVSLIDSLIIEKNSAKVNVIQLGQFRKPEFQISGEKLNIKWFKNNIEDFKLKDKVMVNNLPKGNWKVEVKLNTPEIRSDPSNFTLDSYPFTI